MNALNWKLRLLHEHWSSGCETFSFAITGINYIKLLQFLNYNNTLQYYCFYYIFDQMQPWWEYETTFKNI